MLTRPSGKTTLPDSVKKIESDYASVDALTEILRGQDALVSSLGDQATSEQDRLIEAAIAAKVKRVIPSDYGTDLANPKSQTLPVLKHKVETTRYLEEQAAKGAVTYTLIYTGPFLELGLKFGFLINIKERKALLYDGGDVPFSATTVSSIGKAVVGVLTHYDETKNRPVYTEDVVLTQKKLLKIAQKVTGTSDDQWEITTVETASLEAAAYEELKKESPNGYVVAFNFIKRSIFGEGYGGRFAKVDNELLGLKGMTDEELERLVASMK